MIRYYAPANAWLTGKNVDDQGMPSSDLTGDLEICICSECKQALKERLGSNIDQLP